MRAALTRLLALVLPVECAGCGTDDDPWCARCRAAFAGDVRRCEDDAARLDPMDGTAPLPVWTVADAVGPVRAAVIAWKDRGRADLSAPLAEVAYRLGVAAAAATRGAAGDVLVVPAPSSAAARRRRGRSHTATLAAGVVAGLGAAGVAARTADVLVRRGGDQVGLGARDRERNLHGRVRVRAPSFVSAQASALVSALVPALVPAVVPLRAHVQVTGQVVVLVDDVLTTGATLAAARRALLAEGAHVVAGVVLAATPPPGAPVGRHAHTSPSRRLVRDAAPG
ncbi:hypothetical protein CCO02nite_17930 [Cellulomonas composti]|uniref:Phosphoribosyltransferase domain-containing protein n=1 Tax=Cellulomonas composti TaxID=266130 RepID=A0A511JAX4_9CELL|nr:hypothetical protein CCO02nite_17930 [Cellulomonas composti]